ncbi:MAG: DUF1015 domain-containing protein, partial [Rubrobacteridae bacterium]|nr:DUF1015 domain-containing protein [Rubrobacteridae bacterium]
MAEIRTFKGVFYNKGIVGDLENVVAPPYDVISPDDHKNFLKTSKYNVVRLILPQGTVNSKYTHAKDTFVEWMEKGVIVRDIEPAIYIYEQEYKAKGATKKRIGFIALSKIEDFSTGKIKAHERTLKGPKADRLRLLKACKTNFSQIFSLYSDPEQKIDTLLYSFTKNEPRIDMVIDDVRHRLWTLSDESTINEIQDIIKEKQLFIADGHHRYETALNYRDEMRQWTGDSSGTAPFDFTMMMFVNMDSDGLTVFPTHRALKNLPKINYDKFKENLGYVFDLEKLPSIEALMRELKKNDEQHAMGMYIGNYNYFLLKIKNEAAVLHLLDSDHSKAWKLLDVTILHQVIISRVLGFGGTNIENSIKFTIDENETVSLVNEGGYQMSFMLNPTKITSIKEI